MAAAKSVELRTVAEVERDDVLNWLAAGSMELCRDHLDIERFSVELDAGTPDLSPRQIEILTGPVADETPVLLRHEDGALASPHAVWSASPEKARLRASVDPGQSRKVQLNLNFPDRDQYDVETVMGPVAIAGAIFRGTYRYDLLEMPIERVREYRDEAGVMVQTAEISFDDGAGESKLSIQQAVHDSGLQIIGFAATKKGEQLPVSVELVLTGEGEARRTVPEAHS